jgi:hypothetical protein
MQLNQTHKAPRHIQDKDTASPNPPAIAYLTIFLAGLLAATTINLIHDYIVAANHRELLRVTSPTGSIDAVFVRPIFDYFNAASALYLVPAQESPPAWGAVLRLSGDTDLPRLVWKGPQLLEVQFSGGCVQGFSNLWHSSDVAGGRYYVETRLVPSGSFSCVGNTSAEARRREFPF